MRYGLVGSENTGLSFYEQPMDVVSGLSGLDFAGLFDDAAFKGVAGTLYTYIFNNVTPMKKATITASPSYVPDMLRLYMNMVARDRKAYTPADYENYWLKEFTLKGFDPAITKLFFERFYKLNNDGLVPRGIWFPNPQSSGQFGSQPQYVTTSKDKKGLSTGAMIGIGAAGVAAIAGLYFAFK